MEFINKLMFSDSDDYIKPKPKPKKEKKKKKKGKKKDKKKAKSPKISNSYQSGDSEPETPKPKVNNPEFTSQNGLSSGRVYSDLTDFAKIAPSDDLKKLVMIGLEGTGKSSLLNLLANVDQLDPSHATGRFREGSSKTGVTREAQFMLAHCLGSKKKKRAMLIDTPGVLGATDLVAVDYDSDSDEEGAEDKFSRLISKLEPLREVHLVVVLLPLERGGRLNADVLNLVKGLAHMFRGSGEGLFESLVFAYSKCDEDTPSAYEHIKEAREEEFEKLREELEKHDVRIGKTAKSPLLFLTSRRKRADKPGQKKELNKLVKMLKKSKGLSTANLSNPRQYFEGGTN